VLSIHLPHDRYIPHGVFGEWRKHQRNTQSSAEANAALEKECDNEVRREPFLTATYSKACIKEGRVSTDWFVMNSSAIRRAVIPKGQA